MNIKGIKRNVKCKFEGTEVTRNGISMKFRVKVGGTPGELTWYPRITLAFLTAAATKFFLALI